MLVHHFVHGTKPCASPEYLATVITLAAFGTLPDPEIVKDTPFIQKIKGENDTPIFFCFENQFTIGFREREDRYEFLPNWHCLRDEAKKKEQAIVTLFDHLFKQESYANGF